MSGLIVGAMFYQFGNDGSKTLFNIGFCFVSLIAVLYIPLLPILLACKYFIFKCRYLFNLWNSAVPTEVQMLKREYFNRWYGLTSYFCAYTVARLPGHIILTSIYVIIAYFMTDQPLEVYRFTIFLLTMLVVGCVSESVGMILGSIFNVVVSLSYFSCFKNPHQKF